MQNKIDEETTIRIDNNGRIEVTDKNRKAVSAMFMSLNRHERRRLGKINDMKIPGSTKPIRKVNGGSVNNSK